MYRFYIFLAAYSFTVHAVSAQEITNNQQLVLSEMIEKETRAIDTTSEYEKLADLYVSRGESYLIAGKDKEAFEDFERAYHCATASYLE